MGIIASFLDRRVDLYNILTSTSTATGQPIETLSFVKKVRVYFNPDGKPTFKLFDPGQIKVGKPTAISEVQVVENQVLDISGTKWRVTLSRPAQLKARVLAYILELERWRH